MSSSKLRSSSMCRKSEESRQNSSALRDISREFSSLLTPTSVLPMSSSLLDTVTGWDERGPGWVRGIMCKHIKNRYSFRCVRMCVCACTCVRACLTCSLLPLRLSTTIFIDSTIPFPAVALRISTSLPLSLRGAGASAVAGRGGTGLRVASNRASMSCSSPSSESRLSLSDSFWRCLQRCFLCLLVVVVRLC